MREIIARSIEVGAVTALKPLRPTPNIITAGDLRDYANLLSPLIDSLNDDVQRDASGLSASDSEKVAKGLDDKADGYADGTSLGEFMAAELRKEAKKIRESAAAQSKLTPAQLADRAAFKIEWDSFYARWLPVAAKYKAVSWLTSGGDWTTLQGYDLEYQTLRAKYEGLGLKATMGVPPSAPDIPAASLPDTLKTIATIGAIGLAAYIGVQIFRK
jgi:hypothetical protein